MSLAVLMCVTCLLSPCPVRCQERGLNLRLEMGAVEIPGSGCLAPWNRIWGGPKQWSEREKSNCQVLSADLVPPSSPFKHIQFVHAHTCSRYEGEKCVCVFVGQGGGVQMVRERQEKQRGENNKKYSFGGNNIVGETVTWTCVPHRNQLVQLTNPARALAGASCRSMCVHDTCAHICAWLTAFTACTSYKWQRQTGGTSGEIKGRCYSHACQRRWLIFHPLLSRAAAPKTSLSEWHTQTHTHNQQLSTMWAYQVLSASLSLSHGRNASVISTAVSVCMETIYVGKKWWLCLRGSFWSCVFHPPAFCLCQAEFGPEKIIFCYNGWTKTQWKICWRKFEGKQQNPCFAAFLLILSPLFSFLSNPLLNDFFSFFQISTKGLCNFAITHIIAGGCKPSLGAIPQG